jgi:hypothetical protein
MNYDIWILIEVMLIVFGMSALGYYFFRRQRMLLDNEYAKAQRLQMQVEQLQQRLSSRKRGTPHAAPNRADLTRLRSDVDRARNELHQMHDGIGTSPATQQQEQAVAMIEQLDRQLQATQDVLDRALQESPTRH